MTGEKVVIHLRDGTLKKGYLKMLDEDAAVVEIVRVDEISQAFSFDEIKAIFFVRDFEGKRSYRERNQFCPEAPEEAKRIYIKFFDKETLWGYTEGPLPWEKGFYLDGKKPKGIFVCPTDPKSNNKKIYVVLSAVEDLTVA